MKKFISITISLILIFLISTISFLSIKGHETHRFNKLISEEISKIEPNLKVDLKTIKIKIDLKKFSLFFSTLNPAVSYQGVNLPIEQSKIYINFVAIFKSKANISRIKIKVNELKIEEIKKIAIRIKPSNFKSFLLNNVSSGTMQSEIDLDFDANFNSTIHKISGSIKNTNFKIFDDIIIVNTKFNFIADNNLVLLNSISANIKSIPVSNGSIKINRQNGILVEGSLSTKIMVSNDDIKKILPNLKNSNILKNKVKINGNIIHKFNINLSRTLELKNYNYNFNGNISEAKLDLTQSLNSNFLNNPIEKISFNKTLIKFDSTKDKKNKLFLEGNYSFNQNNEFYKYRLESNFSKALTEHDLNLNFNEQVFIDILNYKKISKNIASIDTKFNISKNKINFKKFNYKEGDSTISLSNLVINKNKIVKLNNLKVKTFKKGKENNNFNLAMNNKIIIKGKQFDGSNLIKKINKESKSNIFEKINNDIEINIENITTTLSIPINKFNLIGKIKKGKFVKILSKSEFPENKYLDISLVKTKNSAAKVLEIYSDLPKVILADFSFFNGIEGGSMIFKSIVDEKKSESKLVINNFRVKNAPGFAKLLALADFGGMVDLLSGDGLSFDTLEINLDDNKKVLSIKEIYAVGPSISILMDGYKENKSGLVSLRGTMVPAKNLNKFISKIPVLGDILIPKEVGEGLFGVSFKMKGLPGAIKTSVNPLKTLTPRFITKILEKKKKD